MARGRPRAAEHCLARREGGDFFVDRIRADHIEGWKTRIADLIAAGDYSPTTVNGWMSILRVIMKGAKRRFRLPYLATEDVKDFDTSEHATYTEEEPNALTPEEVPKFLETMREVYPQHYAMTFLGLVTGLRPSTLRPFRRRGPEPDVLWDKARLRRSQIIGDEVMRTTKTKEALRDRSARRGDDRPPLACRHPARDTRDAG